MKKKIPAIILSVMMLFVSARPVFAENAENSDKRALSVSEISVCIKGEFSSPKNRYTVDDFGKDMFLFACHVHNSHPASWHTEGGDPEEIHDTVILTLRQSSAENIEKAEKLLSENELVYCVIKRPATPFIPDSDSIVVPGDMDGDRAVTPADARIILRIAVGLECLNETNNITADLDGDGQINISDARLAMRWAVMGLNYVYEAMYDTSSSSPSILIPGNRSDELT